MSHAGKSGLRGRGEGGGGVGEVGWVVVEWWGWLGCVIVGWEFGGQKEELVIFHFLQEKNCKISPQLVSAITILGEARATRASINFLCLYVHPNARMTSEQESTPNQVYQSTKQMYLKGHYFLSRE